ncbi:UDP-N-acetylmuramoyl-L-alanine--D-glutamate ligase [Ottowia sp. VDI28]|uniref:UDP-N-acetylmuramoyl-L-alanine--D-glutamate ligase n=1 Tax=Ottowia sp. VDI28 TaxID=3133968 RepID=UPI003C2E3F06
MQAMERHVLVLGLGLSGLAMARWCARHGARVTVADTREAPPQLELLRAEIPAARFVAGPLDATLLQDDSISVIYRSPGLPPAELASLTAAARERSLAIDGELGLFTQGLEALKAERGYSPAVLAITGTNGKTTVTSLTGQLVERAGKSVVVAGNIGPSLLDMLSQALDQEALPEVWVLELSSFQLDSVAAFEPTAATVLNLTQDHLDWHGDMAAYAAAKAKIFGASGVMILNRDDPLVAAQRPPAPVGKAARLPQRPVLTFGAGMPAAPSDFGIEMVNGMAWLVRALEADETLRRRKNAEQEIHLQRLMPVDALRIRGRHNAVNALAALALAVSSGCSLAPMLFGLREYRGEPHRVESIGLLGDVEYFDDSKGTNVGATVAALNGLGADRRLVVILGGDGKGQDFAPLVEPVSRFVRAAVLIGRDAPQIRAALESTGVPLLDAKDMAQAVALAHENAQAGDAVLLSPACASLDMYRNYAHRAEAFGDAVREIAHDAGLELEVPV